MTLSPAKLSSVAMTENKIMRRTIRDLLAAGYLLSVNDGEEITVHQSINARQVFAAMRTTDEDSLIAYATHSPDGILHAEPKRRGAVQFIYGNDGPDVICDYSMSLESTMEGVNAYAASLDV